MFDDNQNNKPNDRDPKKPAGGFRLPPTTWVAWIAIIGSIAALMLLKNHITTETGTLSQADFFKLFQSNLITQAAVNLPTFNRVAVSQPRTTGIDFSYRFGR